MKTSSAKAKGRRLSQELKEELLKWAPDLQDDDFVITGSGATGEDVKLSPLARSIYPFAIECKNQEALSIWKCLAQAESHAEGTDHTPLLVFKRNRSEIYVSLKLEHLLKLIR